MACVTKRRGRYVLDCYDQNGKRYQKTLPLGTTKDEAKKQLRGIEEKIERRTFTHEKKALTFKEVAEQWHGYKETRCRANSWKHYGGIIRLHFPDLDGMKISRITVATIEKFITDRQTQSMNLTTLRHVLAVLNQVMKYAVRHRMIDFNPVRDAERPKPTGKLDESFQMKILNPEQIRALIEAEPAPKFKMLFITAVMTGAREGELLGLKWSDMNFETKQVHIQRTYNTDEFFEPKTKGSNRKIDLSPLLVRELLAWKVKSGGRNDDLVFPGKGTGPMSCRSMYAIHYRPALERAKLPMIRFHDLRHTYASLLIQQGENIKYIQSQLGHATPTMTLNVYAHLMEDTNQTAVCKLENTIFQQSGDKMVKTV